MRSIYSMLWVTVMTLILGMHPTEAAAPQQEATLVKANQVLTDSLRAQDQNVPNWLLDRAYAVAVLPEVIKGGVIFGGRYGTGVMTLRQADGSWSNPVFISIAGGSWGLQFGIQATDLILVFTSKASVEGLIGGKVTLGADASVAAGPLGRQSSAATDLVVRSQIYSYSRNKGFFLGLALDGSVISVDHKANANYYEKPGILASEITAPNAEINREPAKTFLATLKNRAATTDAPVQPSAPITAPAETSPDSTNQPITSPQSGGLITYPMEDKNPGSEPPR